VLQSEQKQQAEIDNKCLTEWHYRRRVNGARKKEIAEECDTIRERQNRHEIRKYPVQ
jgi:hypothetical protein